LIQILVISLKTVKKPSNKVRPSGWNESVTLLPRLKLKVTNPSLKVISICTGSHRLKRVHLKCSFWDKCQKIT